jgi:hypothetical protein
MSSVSWTRWVVACTAAELCGIGIVTGTALGVQSLLGEPTSMAGKLETLAAMTAAGALEGAALGSLQFWALRRALRQLRPGVWIGTTVAVAVVGWLLGMSGPLFFGGNGSPSSAAAEPPLAIVLLLAAAAGAGAGLCFGFAQWLVLRHHVERAAHWIPIHIPAWAAAMAAIFLGASLPDASWPRWAIACSGIASGLLGGLLLGCISGIVASRLRPLES